MPQELPVRGEKGCLCLPVDDFFTTVNITCDRLLTTELTIEFTVEFKVERKRLALMKAGL